MSIKRETIYEPEWIVVGAKVAEYQQFTHGSDARVTTITKITPTQIVLANNNRYRRDNMRKVSCQREQEHLLPIGDARVQDTLAMSALTTVWYSLDDARRAISRSYPITVIEVHTFIANAVEALSSIANDYPMP